MTEDTKQITADNLRADFLNATTNWQRWNVLNRALDWAMAASENAEHWRGVAASHEREKQSAAVQAQGAARFDPEWIVEVTELGDARPRHYARGFPR